jgi:AraC family transcriptional regulator
MTVQNLIDRPSDILKSFLVYKEERTFENVISERGQVQPCEIPEVTFKHHLVVLPVKGQLRTNFSANGLTTEQHTCQAGHIAIYPAGTATQCNIEMDGYQYNCLQIETSTVDNTVGEVLDISHVSLSPRFGLIDPLIKTIICQVANGMNDTSPLDRLYVDSLSHALIVHLIQHYATKSHEIRQYENGLSHSQLCHVLGYINAHLEQDIKLADMAAILGMSQYYFCRLFRKSTGVSPYRYVIQQRVERAKHLLRQSPQLSIATIALECGFTNQSSLCKHFRKLTNLTPKAYQKNI